MVQYLRAHIALPDNQFGPQDPVTPPPGNPMLSSGLYRYLHLWVHLASPRDTQKLK